MLAIVLSATWVCGVCADSVASTSQEPSKETFQFAGLKRSY
jgi:hypothetical protein